MSSDDRAISSQGVYASEEKPGRRRGPKRRPLPGYQERSGQRIDAGGHGAWKRGRPRDWRTRSDPLDGGLGKRARTDAAEGASSAPTTLYEYLQEQYPGQYPQVLRTLQRAGDCE